MKIKAFLFALLLLVLSSFSVSAQSANFNGTGTAPDFTLTDLSGNAHNLYTYLDSGKVVVVEFMNVYCGSCASHASGLESFYATYGPNGTDEAMVLSVEINNGTDSTACANFVNNHGLTHPLINNASAYSMGYAVTYTPTYYVVYPNYAYVPVCYGCSNGTGSSTIESTLTTLLSSTPPVYGCTDSLATNYDPLANTDDGSCIVPDIIITSPADGMQTSISDVWVEFVVESFNVGLPGTPTIDGHIHYSLNGGMVMQYNTAAIQLSGLSAGTHTLVVELVDNAHASLSPVVADTITFTVNNSILGCTDSNAFNYDSDATQDDGSCFYVSSPQNHTVQTVGMTFSPDTLYVTVGDTITFNIGPYHNVTQVDEATYLANGTTYNGGFYFSTGVNSWVVPTVQTYYYVCQPHSSMGMKGVIIASAPPIYGCTDSSYVEYDPAYTVDDGSCTYLVGTATIPGCTNPLAINFLSYATVDDGSCCLTTDYVSESPDILGIEAGEQNGSVVSISSDGSVMAVGAGRHDGLKGCVRVFKYNGASWMQLGGDIDGDAYGDLYGSSISLSGNGGVVVIGAELNDDGGTDAGRTRVYAFNGSSWVQKGGDIYGAVAFDNSGSSVSVNDDGSIVAIGADDHGSGNSGHVRIFEFNGSSWVQLGNDIDGESFGDVSGPCSLNADGDIIAIGAPGNGPYTTGHVRVFEYNGLSWVQIGSDIDGQAGHECIGYSVSISDDGTRVATGGPGIYGIGGVARVYEFNGNNWVQLGTDIDGGTTTNDYFARGVSLSGDGGMLAVCAPKYDKEAWITDSGRAIFYSYDGYDWSEISSVIGENTEDESGSSVDLSYGGDIAAVGEIGYSLGGRVRTFKHHCVGCTDPTSVSFNPAATADDQSCCSAPTGLNTYDVVHTRATFNFTSTGADYYKIRVKLNGGSWQVITQLGTATGTPGGSTKTKYFLTADASYEWQVRAWCIDGQVSGWSSSAFFNTLPECNNPTVLGTDWIEAEYVGMSWEHGDNANGASKYIGQMREVGSNSWSTFASSGMLSSANPGVDQPTPFKEKAGLTVGATYEYQVKTWCNTGDENNPTDPYYRASGFGPELGAFTTVPCLVQTENLGVSYNSTNANGASHAFSWDVNTDDVAPADRYIIQFTVAGAGNWQNRNVSGGGTATGRNIGGFTVGTEYAWRVRTYCSESPSARWRSDWVYGPNFVAGDGARLAYAPVLNLDVYPNPSRDIFNVTFASEEVQNINVKVVNVIGETIYQEDLQGFTGQYTKAIDLMKEAKGVYTLQITTESGGVNKKIVLQ